MYILHIKIQSYNYKHFKKLKKILNFFFKKQYIKKMDLSNIVIPKNKKKMFTVLRSPHVHNKSRETFKHIKYKRTLKITSKYILNLLYINYILQNFFSKDFNFNSKIKLSY